MKNELNDLYFFCGKHKIDFVLTKEEKKENYIIYNLSDNQIVINISDNEDENFTKTLQIKLKDLEKLFH